MKIITIKRRPFAQLTIVCSCYLSVDVRHCYCCLYTRLHVLTSKPCDDIDLYIHSTAAKFLIGYFHLPQRQNQKCSLYLKTGILAFESAYFGEFRTSATKKRNGFISLHFHIRDHQIESLLFHSHIQPEHRFLSFPVTLEKSFRFQCISFVLTL